MNLCIKNIIKTKSKQTNKIRETSTNETVTQSPEVSPSRVGSPDLEHGPATVRAEELPLFDEAVSLDAQIGTHTGVRERGIGELGACNQVHVVAVLHDCLRV